MTLDYPICPDVLRVYPSDWPKPFSISDPLSKTSDAHLRRQRRAINGVNLRNSWLACSVQLLSTAIAITTITSFYSYSYMTVKLYPHHTAFCPVCYTGFKSAHNQKSTRLLEPDLTNYDTLDSGGFIYLSVYPPGLPLSFPNPTA